MFKLNFKKSVPGGGIKKYLLIIKNEGKFYNYYGYDAYIMNILFGYKVLPKFKGGFPDNAINKIIRGLDQNKISYQIVFKDKDPIIHDIENNNMYDSYLEKALLVIDKKNRIDLIVQKIKDSSDEQLEEILRILEKCL